MVFSWLRSAVSLNVIFLLPVKFLNRVRHIWCWLFLFPLWNTVVFNNRLLFFKSDRVISLILLLSCSDLSFARMSAISFLWMAQWDGNQCNVIRSYTIYTLIYYQYSHISSILTHTINTLIHCEHSQLQNDVSQMFQVFFSSVIK